jgi:hypothetical protein
MTFGNGCCGKVEPAGSDGPGMRLTGREDCRISVMRSEAVFVGCDSRGSRTDALKRFYLSDMSTCIEWPAYRFVIVFPFYWHCKCISR